MYIIYDYIWLYNMIYLITYYDYIIRNTLCTKPDSLPCKILNWISKYLFIEEKTQSFDMSS